MSRQVFHVKEPPPQCKNPFLKNVKHIHVGLNIQPFTGNGDRRPNTGENLKAVFLPLSLNFITHFQ
jgi:hypothetical protein